ENASGMGGEIGQEVELLGLELNHLTATGNASSQQVDGQSVDLKARFGTGGCASADGDLGPPQHRPHARHKLAHRERLDDVIVGAKLQSDDAVDLGVLRR